MLCVFIKKALFSPFYTFFQKIVTQKVTIFHIWQCEKWTKKSPKTVEIPKIKICKLCKVIQGAKKMVEKCKKIC
jgi:hypothetical protein